MDKAIEFARGFRAPSGMVHRMGERAMLLGAVHDSLGRELYRVKTESETILTVRDDFREVQS